MFRWVTALLTLILIGAHVASAKKTIDSTPRLASFKELSTVDSTSRKKYLTQIAALANDSNFDFLDRILVSTNSKLKTKCFSGIYGQDVLIENNYDFSRKRCRQEIDRASLFFADPKNEALWIRFSMKLALMCHKNPSCKSFISHQEKIKKTTLNFYVSQK